MRTKWLQSVLTGSVSAVPVRFINGDFVEVLNERGEVIGDGIIGRTVGDVGNWAYFVTGFPAARPSTELRLIKRGVGLKQSGHEDCDCMDCRPWTY